jgi:Gram-negative bacterial TonB protein C-terminal
MSLVGIDSATKTFPGGLRAPFTERGALRLFVRRDPFFANCRDSIAALASRTVGQPSTSSHYFLRGANVARVRFAGRSLGASFLLHSALLAFLIYLPQAIPAKASPLLSAPIRAEKIYYRVPLLDAARMPRIAPAGSGGRPGSGFLPTRLPALGSTAHHPNMTIVSKPVQPDNFRQTIYQPASPPDLKITTELKLPNIVLGKPSEAIKAPLDPNDARPVQADRQLSAQDAPSVASSPNPTAPLMTFLKPSDTQPRLAIPLAGGGAPIQRSKGGSGSVTGESSSEDAGLVVLGVDPADSGSQISLPGGNRWGEFSIAPPNGTEGSPGGDPSGTAGGGSGGGPRGGDGSTGPGNGGSGGGGGNSGMPGPVSITGPGASGEVGGMLDPTLPMSMVYPVAAPALNIRRNMLVISAGPIGGGGLNVYGALNCGKIYSIFLPMPGKNWSMQYCDKSSNTGKSASATRAAMVYLDKPLIPPDVDLDHRFDFKRISLPPEKSHRSIVLKGVIAVDGTVQHLTVYESVAPEMDEAARIALGRWKFKPAMRDGKPVEVEILVGIPPLAGEDRLNR